jgi:hypothetical protein
VSDAVHRYFGRVVIEDGKASARIVQELFAPEDDISANFAYLAQLSDFPPENPHHMSGLIDNLSSLIIGIQHVDTDITFESLIAHYAKIGSLWTPEFQQVVSDYDLLKRSAERETRDSIVHYGLLKDSDHVQLGVGYAKSVFYMKPALHIIHEEARAPFAIAVFDDGKIVFSARHSADPTNVALTSIDCRVLGIAYGGGGRLEGGGGNVSEGPISVKEFRSIAEGVKENVKRLFDLEDYI